MIKKITTLILALLVFMVPVYAQPIQIQTYDAYADKFFVGAFQASYNLCGCEAVVDRVQITNTGLFDAEFRLSTNNPYAQLPFSSVLIRAGQTQNINIPLNIPCNERPRSLSYDLLVSNNFGGEQVLQRPLTTNRCESLFAELFTQKDNVSPGSTNVYEVLITNNAPFFEEYEVNIIRGANYFDNTNFVLELEPGRQGVVNATFNALVGDFEVKQVVFEVVAKNTNQRTRLTHQLEILREYEFEVSQQEVVSCLFEETTIPISITNKGAVENTFFFETNTFSLSHNNLTLQPDQTLVIEAYTQSNRALSQSDQLRVKTLYGDVSRTLRLEANYINCYNLELDLLVEDFSNICQDQNTFQFQVKNVGVRKTNITSTIEFLGSFQEFEFELDVGEVVSQVFDLEMPEDNNIRTYSIILTSSPKSTSRVFEEKKRVVVYGGNQCTRLLLNNARSSVRYFEDNFSVTLVHRGIRSADYFVSLQGSDKFSLLTNNFTLNPNEQKEVVVVSNISREDIGVHFVALNITSQNQSQIYEIRVNIQDDILHQRLYGFVVNNTCLTITLLLAILFLVVVTIMIIGVLRGYSLTTIGWFRKTLLILIPVILVLTLYVYGGPVSLAERPGEIGLEIPHIRLYLNETFVLNLDNYFEDPDGSNLSYFVGAIEPNLTYNIENNLMSLLSDTLGNTSMTIIASDGLDQTESPEFLLETVSPRTVTLNNYYDAYCPQFNAVFLILILLLAFLTPVKSRKKK